MHHHSFIKTSLGISLIIVLSSFILLKKEKPVFYIIGDSTVKNGNGTGRDGQWGWGDFIAGYFDTSKISVRNHAIGGRSSRTFITEGRWDRIMSALKKGDYVIMQFGHNDGGPLDDTARARGSIRGIGDESKDIYNPITQKNETVYYPDRNTPSFHKCSFFTNQYPRMVCKGPGLDCLANIAN